MERLKTDDKYKSFLLENELGDVESFLQRGVFASNTGDFVVDACCQILRVPITVVQSLGRLTVHTFLPSAYMCTRPLIVAYNVGENHYSSTKRLMVNQVEDSTPAEKIHNIINIADHDYFVQKKKRPLKEKESKNI